jgi:molecular chaperone GrpE (heat shock protein)
MVWGSKTMDSLEERQRQMRDRNSAASKRKRPIAASPAASLPEDSPEAHMLKKQIAELEKRLLTLEAENQRLRKQKTIIVERAPQQTSEDAPREQRHNFFKYSNVRRY